jgi:3-hydroxyacyl-CoA dehydrogenase/enoyl-CoA hydratase/3-hydroxybutyryl-CoA epimerase
MVEKGRLGQKSPAGGFYQYRDGKPQRRKAYPPPDSELIDRLILRLVNEAATCVSEGIVEDADLLDAGVVFGTGFAPHTGGPINYAMQCGIDQITERLLALREKHGQRFVPSPAWSKIGRAA